MSFLIGEGAWFGTRAKNSRRCELGDFGDCAGREDSTVGSLCSSAFEIVLFSTNASKSLSAGALAFDFAVTASCVGKHLDDRLLLCGEEARPCVINASKPLSSGARAFDFTATASCDKLLVDRLLPFGEEVRTSVMIVSGTCRSAFGIVLVSTNASKSPSGAILVMGRGNCIGEGAGLSSAGRNGLPSGSPGDAKLLGLSGDISIGGERGLI